ncbi:MAG: hypothetical protein ACE5FS_07485 [Paracoccaceae bacterium]
MRIPFGEQKKLLAGACALVLFCSAPWTVSFDDNGGLSLKPAVAEAKNGSDDSGNSGSGSDDSGSGSNSGSGSSNSGSGSSNSGSGSDDSGSGSNSGSGSSNSGSGSSNSGSGSGGGGHGGDRIRAPKVEITADGVEVVFADGTKEEIRNGWYELKNTFGRTIAERRATQEDFMRLSQAAKNARGAATAATNASVVKFEQVGDNVEVVYASGWKEEIQFGRYELKDANNNTVVERPATAEDLARILAGIAP